MHYKHPHYIWLDNEWFRQALERMFAELEAYLAKWARFVELMGK
jgi:hypothetical protein